MCRLFQCEIALMHLGSSLNFQPIDFSVIWHFTDLGDGGRSRGCDGPGILAC